MSSKIFHKVIRILTVAPLMAALALTVLFFFDKGIFGTTLNYVLCLIFLTAFPLLAYPLQPIVPGFKGKGRDGQRNLAIVMSVLGYIGGIIAAVVVKAPVGMWVLLLTYLLSGAGILLFNKVFHIKASGHSCGIVGPTVYLAQFIGAWALWGVSLLLLACASSLKMKRHTFSQLVWGGVIPVMAFLLSVGVVQIVF